MTIAVGKFSHSFAVIGVVEDFVIVIQYTYGVMCNDDTTYHKYRNFVYGMSYSDSPV